MARPQATWSSDIRIVSPASAGRCTLLTLGGLELRGPAAAAGVLRQPKRAALLLYLLLSNGRGFASRDELMAVFWPESDSGRARNSLRQALSFLRDALGRHIIVNQGASSVEVAQEALACDAVRFEALLDEGRTEEALALYRGDLGRGLHVTGSPGFGDWLSGERERLRRRAASAAWTLSSGCESAGDAEEAALWGKRALALSPFSESEVQKLLRLLDRLGDWAEALRAYEGLEAYLASEFDARPSRETVRLLTSIRERLESGDIPTTAFEPRRSASDRRRGERRQDLSPWSGTERRALPDRRVRERRSGRDRRGEG